MVFVDDVTNEAQIDSERGPPDHSLLEQLMTISRAVALEEMASGIAHELNQPLGAIVTFAQAAERIAQRPDSSPTSVADVLKLISKEALAAADGIRRMRRLFDRSSLNIQSSSMADVLRELAPVLELLGSQTGVDLHIAVDSPLCPVSIDRRRVQLVLFTLVQNAFEATHLVHGSRCDGHVTIRVKGDRYGIEVSVIDTGTGISDEHRPQIFHPFFTTKTAGTGLGLTSARAIIEAHQGTIGFERLDTQGTRFWFRLPAGESGEER